MSTEVPTPTKGSPVVVSEPDSRRFRFPPFPAVPEGVTIIPFKDFQERGIQVFVGADEVERDGLGIPTVPLRVKHDTDVSKTDPNRKKKSAKELIAARPGFRKEWWEDWEEGEDLRNHGPYNDNIAPADRFHQAASDFQKYRKFPPLYTNVQGLWDQFRIFSGLLGTTPVWQKASEKAPDGADADADVSDGESDAENAKSVNPGEKRFPLRPRPRAPYELYGKEPVPVEDNDDIRGLLDAARATKDDRLVDFLSDPARGIQMFLSSYMKNQGLAWADRNLTNAPHLLRFFVNYLLRNKTIAAAGRELPLTATISKVLPDDFSAACQGCWGRRADSYGDLADSDSDGGVDVLGALPAVDDADAAASEGGSGAWGETAAYDPSSFAPAGDSWDGAPSATDWAAPEAPSLLALLGPTALPLTHAPGVVEWSGAEAVERGLEGRMHRVVLAPWAGWDGEVELSQPRILRSSVGAVAAAPAPSSAASAPPATGAGGLKPHDMHADDITLLVDGAVAGTLCVGMGLGGTWVQLARVQDVGAPPAAASEEGNAKTKKKKALSKAQKERRGLRYWYLDDELTMSLPSYWIP
ncbi:hypothetical protein B0H17DRAFT_1338146 [Mycena rosella]|uniref:Uncharacterized protein n=1 Tax=Mycena rosella TaxID=1033263 RepID=A0AAD7G4D8_MYCRO|nr:hypothetical protein B0H17DRAFT_1338146 [Mycena rosella]